MLFEIVLNYSHLQQFGKLGYIFRSHSYHDIGNMIWNHAHYSRFYEEEECNRIISSFITEKRPICRAYTLSQGLVYYPSQCSYILFIFTEKIRRYCIGDVGRCDKSLICTRRRRVNPPRLHKRTIAPHQLALKSPSPGIAAGSC